MPAVTFAHRLEAAAAGAALALFKALPPAAASNLAGAIARTIGPHLGTSRTADRNLAAAFPDLTAAARAAIITQVWDTMGRNAGELPHLPDLQETASGPGITVTGWEDHWAPALAKGGPSIMLTGHYGNWEAIPRLIRLRGVNHGFIYRAASNRLVDDMIQSIRRRSCGADVPMFPKGGAGARGAYAHMMKGGQVGMLMDQKLDTGLSLPFFGRPAMTGTALASFALKFRCPILPMRGVRRGPARIEIICDPAVKLPDTGDKARDIAALTLATNQIYERWIREDPGAWLWLHRRWPK